MMPDLSILDTARLKWRCRRGLLELDLLLHQFLKTDLAWLDQAQRHAFERLLDYPDHILLEMLMARQMPADTGIVDVVARIRSATVHHS